MRLRTALPVFFLALVLLLPGPAISALPPSDLGYQGQLLDPTGNPLAGPVNIEIGVWDQPTGGTWLYGETHTGVVLADGVFSLLLGTGTVLQGSFDAALFAAQNRYLEVIVGGEVLTPRQPFSSVAYALQSAGAESVGGLIPSSLVTMSNLDASFASQVSQVSEVQIPTTIARDTDVQAVGAQVTSVQGQVATVQGEVTTLQAEMALQQNDVTTLQAENASQQSDIAILQAQVVALQALLAGISRNGGEIYITGANLHIVSGSGATDGAVNGLGNLIVGYNELRGDATDDRSGSHNLIVGSRQSYSSYGGGLVGGDRNNILAPYASITGGQYNTASGSNASLSGGWTNTASAWYASVNGGEINTASGTSSSVSGGRNNTAGGTAASVAGGGGAQAWEGNEAFANYSAILGGGPNLAGDPAKLDPTIGKRSSVSGGWHNTASGDSASVSGGDGNQASGPYSSVSGGFSNTASEFYSSISGGRYNAASGLSSSVSGGESNTASGNFSSASGGSSNTASASYSSVSGGAGRSATGPSNWRAGSLIELY